MQVFRSHKGAREKEQWLTWFWWSVAYVWPRDSDKAVEKKMGAGLSRMVIYFFLYIFKISRKKKKSQKERRGSTVCLDEVVVMLLCHCPAVSFSYCLKYSTVTQRVCAFGKLKGGGQFQIFCPLHLSIIFLMYIKKGHFQQIVYARYSIWENVRRLILAFSVGRTVMYSIFLCLCRDIGKDFFFSCNKTCNFLLILICADFGLCPNQRSKKRQFIIIAY